MSLASVIIVTHNRRELLRKSLRAVLEQDMPVQLIVMDDASDDGTGEMIRSEFPQAIYHRTNESKGPSWQRNEGAQKACTDFLIFLDDDTILMSPDSLSATLRDFDDPRIGAVAMPFVNVLQNEKVMPAASVPGHDLLVHAFIAAAFAIRTICFHHAGGFREEYFYMGEEGDLCLRLLDEGYYVKAGTAVPAHHYQPAGRVSFAADFYGRRNDIYFLYLNSPRSILPGAMIITMLRGLWFGLKVGRPGNMIRGMIAGLSISFSGVRKNASRPVQKFVFRQYRYLKKHEPLEMASLAMRRTRFNQFK